jgi:hypothetical protein
MKEQFAEWQKSAHQLEEVKKMTGTLQQIQQGIDSSQATLDATRDQVQHLVQAARDLQSHPQSVTDQMTADLTAANAKTVSDWVKFQDEFKDFKKEYALDVKESKDMISRLDEIIGEMEHSAQMVKGKGAATLVVSRATKATLNSMLDEQLKRFTREYIADCASKRIEPVLKRDLDLLEQKLMGEITRLENNHLSSVDGQAFTSAEKQYKRLARRLETIEKAELTRRIGALEKTNLPEGRSAQLHERLEALEHAGLIGRVTNLETGHFQHFQELLEHGFKDGTEHPFVTRLRMLEGWRSQLEVNGVKIDLQPVEARMQQLEEFKTALEASGVSIDTNKNLESRMIQL